MRGTGIVLWMLLMANETGCEMSNQRHTMPGKKGATAVSRTQPDEFRWGDKEENLAMSLSVAKEAYRLGELIPLRISLKNFGSAPVPVVIRSPWSDYTLKIQYERRVNIEKTSYGLQMAETAAEGRRATRQLMPEEVITEDLELTQGYDMKLPGSYTIVASRIVYKNGETNQYATITSNELVVKIIEE